MATKNKITGAEAVNPKPRRQAALSKTEMKPASAKFPAVVMGLADKLNKVPFAYWYENGGKTIAIQWDDLSKDRFEAG